MKPAFRSSLLLLAAAEAAAQEAGLEQRSGILADGTYGQRAECHYRQGLVDWSPDRTAELARCVWNMATSVPS
jgi:myo-inositol catabolism protein IolC